MSSATDSRSWFINIKKILLKYEFSNINELLTNPIKSQYGSRPFKGKSCLIASCFSIALSGCLHILLNRVMHLMSIIASTGSNPDRI
jgi:hypothetical protein